MLPWPIFLLYEVRSECQYVLSNLAAGYTRSTLVPNCKGSQIANFVKKPQVDLNIIREWPKEAPSFYKNLIIPPGVFYLTPLQLGTKEYLTIWKIIYVYIKSNWRYFLRKNLQCYRTNIGDLNCQGTLHSFLLLLVPQDKPLIDYSFSLSDLKLGKPKRAL